MGPFRSFTHWLRYIGKVLLCSKHPAWSPIKSMLSIHLGKGWAKLPSFAQPWAAPGLIGLLFPHLPLDPYCVPNWQAPRLPLLYICTDTIVQQNKCSWRWRMHWCWRELCFDEMQCCWRKCMKLKVDHSCNRLAPSTETPASAD
jgi:hypothetical protein